MNLILSFINYILLISREICEVKKKKIDIDIHETPGGAYNLFYPVFLIRDGFLFALLSNLILFAISDHMWYESRLAR